MDWREPATPVMSHGTAAIIRALAGAETPFSVRELARLAEVSQTRARHAVDALSQHGLVIVRTDPAFISYSSTATTWQRSHRWRLATMRTAIDS